MKSTKSWYIYQLMLDVVGMLSCQFGIIFNLILFTYGVKDVTGLRLPVFLSEIFIKFMESRGNQ